jgi:molecular chaperone GrpE
MNGMPEDEQILDRFREWLAETRQEMASGDAESRAPARPPAVGIDRLVGEFTALRQEVKLQTRSARGLEERLEAAIGPLVEASGLLRDAASRPAASSRTEHDKTFALALAELDEALDRGYEQWNKAVPVLAGETAARACVRLEQIHAALPWWRRAISLAYHKRVCEAIADEEATAQKERQALLTAVLSGYRLIQQRLARAMSKAGVLRIPARGRAVDLEVMVVVEVVPGDAPPGHVIDEVRRGYTWQGQVLRPAEVRSTKLDIGNSPGSEL